MAITALPTPPSRSDPTNFATRADAFLGALPTFATEANALQTDVNSKQETASAAASAASASAASAAAAQTAALTYSNATGTSAQTKTTGLGSFTFTDVQSGKSWVAGQPIQAYADSSNYMLGTVTSYSGTTLVINSIYNVGTASRSSWSFFPTTTVSLPIFSNTGGLKPVSSGEVITSAVSISIPSFTDGRFIKSSSLGIMVLNNRGYVMTTSDGSSYTARTLPTTTQWDKVSAYGSNCLIGFDTTAVKSTDGGATWSTSTAFPVSLGNGQLFATASNHVATYYYTTVTYSTTPDGTTFTTRNAQFPGVTTNPNVIGVAATAGLMLVTFSGSRYGMRSTDNGATWTQVDFIDSKSFHGGIHNSGGNIHLLFGDTVNSASVARSTDLGATWTTYSPGGTNAWYAGTWGNGIYLLYNSNNVPYSSTTGASGSWTAQTALAYAVNDVKWCASANLFVTAGNSGSIYTTPTGVTHTSRTSGVTTHLYAVVDTGTKILIAGQNGVLLSSNSADGTTWAALSTATTETLSTMVWTGSLVVGRTLEGSTFTCNASGTSFTLYPQDLSNALSVAYYKYIAWDGTKFVTPAGYGNQTVATGTTASDATSLFKPYAFSYGTCNAAGTAIAVCGKTVYRTSDGVTWTPVLLSKPVYYQIGNINISGDDKWYMMSHDGLTMFSSADATTWSSTSVAPALQSPAYKPIKVSATGPFISKLTLATNAQTYIDPTVAPANRYSPHLNYFGDRDRSIVLSNGTVLMCSNTTSIATLNNTTAVFTSN